MTHSAAAASTTMSTMSCNTGCVAGLLNSYLVVELAVHRLTLRIHQLEGVASVAVHEAVAVRSATITEQERHLVCRLRTEGDEVPEHVRVLQVGDRVALLSVDEAGEEDGVTDEEDGSVISHQVPDAILGVVLHSKSAWVTGCVSAARFTTWKYKKRRSLKSNIRGQSRHNSPG